MRPHLPYRQRIILLFASMIFAAPALANNDQSVLVIIEKDGAFKVLHSRAESSATGMVFFGLIGYGIAEGSRSGKDQKREDEILAYIPDSACRPAFEIAMQERLAEKGYTASLSLEKSDGDAVTDDYDFTVRVKLHACGYKLINSTSDQLSAFFAASYSITPQGEKHGKFLDMLLTGTRRGSWSELLAEPETSAEQFDAIRIKAGRRIANRLIYPR